MTQYIGQGFDIHALLNAACSKGVPKRVKVYRFQIAGLQDLLVPVLKCSGAYEAVGAGVR